MTQPSRGAMIYIALIWFGIVALSAATGFNAWATFGFGLCAGIAAGMAIFDFRDRR